MDFFSVIHSCKWRLIRFIFFNVIVLQSVAISWAVPQTDQVAEGEGADKSFASPTILQTLRFGGVLAIAPHGNYFLELNTAEIQMRDIRTGDLLRCLPGTGARILAIAFSPDGRLFKLRDAAGTEKTFNAGTGQEIAQKAFDAHYEPWREMAKGDYAGSSRDLVDYVATHLPRLAQDQAYRSELPYEHIVSVIISDDGAYALLGTECNQAIIADCAGINGMDGPSYELIDIQIGKRIGLIQHDTVGPPRRLASDGKNIIVADTRQSANSHHSQVISRLKLEYGVTTVKWSKVFSYPLCPGGERR
jgi:hypothetical protein